MRLLSLVATLFALSGCAHNLTLMARNSGEMGTGVAQSIDKSVVINVGGKTYRGKYTYATGGSYSFGSATAFSGNRIATASGTGYSMSMRGDGNVLARADDGSGLRCVFNYSSWEASGAGECQDDAGKVYDVQIH